MPLTTFLNTSSSNGNVSTLANPPVDRAAVGPGNRSCPGGDPRGGRVIPDCVSVRPRLCTRRHLDQATEVRNRDGLGARMDAQLAEDSLDMGGDGCLADDQLVGDRALISPL